MSTKYIVGDKPFRLDPKTVLEPGADVPGAENWKYIKLFLEEGKLVEAEQKDKNEVGATTAPAPALPTSGNKQPKTSKKAKARKRKR